VAYTVYGFQSQIDRNFYSHQSRLCFISFTDITQWLTLIEIIVFHSPATDELVSCCSAERYLSTHRLTSSLLNYCRRPRQPHYWHFATYQTHNNTITICKQQLAKSTQFIYHKTMAEKNLGFLNKKIRFSVFPAFLGCWSTGIRGLMRGMATLPKVTRSY